MDKIIIKACLNGNRSREVSPHIPWSPEEVADEAVRAWNAGASIVHFHARDEQGGISYDPEWYREADERIRERCDLVLNHTTLRTEGEPISKVLRYLEETPEPVDMVSVNMGYGIGWVVDPATGGRQTRVIPNGYEDIEAILDICYARGIFPEPGIHGIGMLNNTLTLVRDGKLRSQHYFLLETDAMWGNGVQGMPGTPANYFLLTATLESFFPDAIWVAHGNQEYTVCITSLAIATGAHVRVGFEDSFHLPHRPHPRSNAEHVEWAVDLARLHGREPATPREAREMIGLPLPVG